jgi:L,D-peptidoglycan transpeptidase YkuD (ErfK/YbiS/YcfS/YnhG family)
MKFLASLPLLGVLAGCASAADPKPAATPAISATAEAAAQAADADPSRAWSDAGQLVLVITPGQDATTGRMRAFDRVGESWKPAGEAFDVTVGRSGIAWGLGLHPPQPGLAKREGDGRAPAGVFRIGTAFGYDTQARTGLAYAPMSATHWCVDVDGAPLYNRIVDSREVGAAAVAASTEPMRRDIHAKGDQRLPARLRDRTQRRRPRRRRQLHLRALVEGAGRAHRGLHRDGRRGHGPPARVVARGTPSGVRATDRSRRRAPVRGLAPALPRRLKAPACRNP